MNEGASSMDDDSDYVPDENWSGESESDCSSDDGLCYYCSENLDYVDEYYDTEACRYYCLRCYEEIHQQGFL